MITFNKIYFTRGNLCRPQTQLDSENLLYWKSRDKYNDNYPILTENNYTILIRKMYILRAQNKYFKKGDECNKLECDRKS